MIYTVSQGLNTNRDKLRGYLFRGLPIAAAVLIAAAGILIPRAADQSRQINERPLAIYTATSSDFGAASNPQGNGTDTQSSDTKESSTASTSTLGSNNQASSPQPSGSSGDSAGQPLVGGRGSGESSDSGSNEDSGCLCESLPSLPINPQTVTTDEELPNLPDGSL